MLQRAQLPPGQLPFDLQYHGRYVAILSLDPELREAGPFGWRCGALDPWQRRGVVVDEEPVPSPRIAIDEGGRRLVTGRGDGSVAVFDILDGSSTTMSGRHSSAVIDSSFSSDGKLIASGSDDGQAIVWDAEPASRYTSSRGTRPRSSRRAQSGRTNAVHRRARRCDDRLGSRRLATSRAVVPTPSRGTPGERA